METTSCDAPTPASPAANRGELFQFEALEPRNDKREHEYRAQRAGCTGGRSTITPMLTASPVANAQRRRDGDIHHRFSPSQIREIYGFNSLSLNGAGTTIAIVDAYNDPTIARTCNVRYGIRLVRSAADDPQDHDHQQHEVGTRNRARRGMGPCHRAGRQHFARRGQQQPD